MLQCARRLTKVSCTQCWRVPRRGPAALPGQSESRNGSGLSRHNQSPPRPGWPVEARSGNGSPCVDRLSLLQHTWLLQQQCQPGMDLGWCIKGGHKCFPLLWIQLEALPIGQRFGRTGQGAFQYKVCNAAFRYGCGPLQGLLGPWCQPEVQFLATQGGGVTSRRHLLQPPLPRLPDNVMTAAAM